MKARWILLLLTACGTATQQEWTLQVTVNTPKPGLRIYIDGEYQGLSPATISRRLVEREIAGGVKRWFVADNEVFPGGTWPLLVETFKEGVRVPLTLRVPFDPGTHTIAVTAAP